MTDYDDAAIERAAWYLCRVVDGHNDSHEYRFNNLKTWREYYKSEVRHIIELLNNGNNE